MTTTKKIQEVEKEKPNPERKRRRGVGGSTSTSISTTPPPPGSGGPDDRISELPKEILHHILGFLEMDDFLIGTSLVSTKWRYLWKSVSNLNFPTCCMISSRRTDDDDDDSVVVDNGGGGGGGGGIKNNVEKYQNFVDHVLRLRDSQASKIQIFRYYCNDLKSREGEEVYDCLERLHNFIVSAAVNQGAQEIQIMGFHLDDRHIHFNPSIFTSGLLRVFNFDVAVSRLGFGIQFPRSMCCATQLTHLTLSRIRLPVGDHSNAQLHLVCPLLETLVMLCCYSKHLKVLDISAPRLDTLYIDNIGMRNEGSDFLGGCRLEIRTPNLTSLDYEGHVYVDCFMENLPHIADASLRIHTEPGMLEQTTSFAIKLLKGLTSAKTLLLKGFEVFSEDILKELLTPFTSLRTLNLITSCKISSIHGMVHFLNSCSSVENLFWLGNEIRTVESDEHLVLPQCRLSHLKHVYITRLHGHKNEIEFVKFLLKNSIVLEDIIIRTTADSPKQSIEENLKQFIKEEPSLRRCIKLEIRQEES